jgi:hypothetical protein
MALTHSDRRRLALATALTLVALPALWWANQDDGAPNVATVGLDAGAVAANPAAATPTGEAAATEATPVAEPAEPITALSDAPAAAAITPPPSAEPDLPSYMDGPAAEDSDLGRAVAVPAPSGEQLTVRATFRRTVGSRSICIVPGMVNGTTVTVVNLANNRSTTCTTGVAPLEATEMVMHPDRFAEIADLTNAPIHVEIRR